MSLVTIGPTSGVTLPTPPNEYDRAYMTALIRELERVIFQLKNPGITQVAAALITGENLPANLESPLNLGNLPTSSAGLNTGDVWSNAGVLTIV